MRFLFWAKQQLDPKTGENENGRKGEHQAERSDRLPSLCGSGWGAIFNLNASASELTEAKDRLRAGCGKDCEAVFDAADKLRQELEKAKGAVAKTKIDIEFLQK